MPKMQLPRFLSTKRPGALAVQDDLHVRLEVNRLGQLMLPNEHPKVPSEQPIKRCNTASYGFQCRH